MFEDLELSFENVGNRSFIVYRKKEQDIPDNVETEMLRLNKIEGILAFNSLQKNDVVEYRYDITSHLSLKQVFTREVSKEHLFKTFESICLCFENAEDYLLDINHFVTNMEHIFINQENGKIYFIFIPADCPNLRQITFSQFIKNIIYSIRYDTGDGSDFYINTLNYINGMTEIEPRVFRDKLYEFMRYVKNTDKSRNNDRNDDWGQVQEHIAETTKSPVINNSSFVVERQLESKQQKEKKNIFSKFKHEKKEKNIPAVPKTDIDVGFAVPGMPIDSAKEKKSDNIPEESNIPKSDTKQKNANIKEKKKNIFQKIVPVHTNADAQKIDIPSSFEVKSEEASSAVKTVPKEMNRTPVAFADGNERTVLIDEENIGVAYLEDAVSGKKIFISKDNFSIGRNPEYSDCVLTSPTVGRLHLSIIKKDGKFFVIDINSKNGTFINGKRLISNIHNEIVSGDSLKIGTEEYRFYYR